LTQRPVGGEALKRAIRIARAKTDITSDTQLALLAGVHYDTLMNWYGNRTTPRPFEVKKVASVLGVPLSELMSAYEGYDPEPPPLQDAVRELVGEMRALIAESRLGRAQQEEATMALLRALGALARRDPDPPETPGGSGPAAANGMRRST
jgi:transcriptional regulator with XRE-family HTH domain